MKYQPVFSDLMKPRQEKNAMCSKTHTTTLLSIAEEDLVCTNTESVKYSMPENTRMSPPLRLVTCRNLQASFLLSGYFDPQISAAVEDLSH